ncbi:MAG: Tfx family DNA-binding protein [Thermoplasmataceae archaeon]
MEKSGKGMGKHYLFSEKQITVMRYLNEGKSRMEIAEIFHTSVQNVIILERRFRRNVELAANSLKVLRDLDFVTSVKIEKGTHLLDAGLLVLRVADSKGIVLKHNAVSLVSGIRSSVGNDVSRGIIKRDVEVLILPSGSILIL